MEVSVRELKNRLSEYLRRTLEGEEVIITSRGKPVARLSPLEEDEARTEEEALDRLCAMPWVRSGRGGRVRGARNPIAWPRGEKTLAELVAEQRE